MSDCPNSVSGHSGEASNTDGRCRWCGRKVYCVAPRPTTFDESDLTHSYRYAHDPDWGSEKDDW